MTTNKNIKKLKMKSIFKEVLTVAFPIALQGVFLSLVQLVDNLFIGHLEHATDVASGVNAINNITFNISTIVTGFLAGIGVYFAQAAGKEDFQFQKKLFIAKVFWTFVWALSLLIIASLFLKQIASLWLPSNSGSSKALEAAKDYGLIILPSLLIDYFVIIFSSSFKENKKTKLAMYVACIAIIVNSSLNYPFMYTFGWGIRGSAYATLIARSVELVIWLIYIYKKKVFFIPKWNDFKNISIKDIFSVFSKSFWWMINAFAISLAFTLQIMFMSRVSIEAGAALNSAGVFARIVFAFTGGYAVALNIIVMHHIAKYINLDLKYYSKQLRIISMFVGLAAGIIMSSFSWSIFFIYPNYSYNTKIQSIIMICSIGSTIWIGLVSSIYISMLKGFGYAKILLILDGLYSWVISLPLTLMLIYGTSFISLGYIYWIVSASLIFKPWILNIFFNKKVNSFKPLLKNEIING